MTKKGPSRTPLLRNKRPKIEIAMAVAKVGNEDEGGFQRYEWKYRSHGGDNSSHHVNENMASNIIGEVIFLFTG